MKKEFSSLQSFIFIFCSLFISRKYIRAIIFIAILALCSIPVFAESKEKSKVARSLEIIDYMGRDTGGKSPDWVTDILSSPFKGAKQYSDTTKKTLGLKDTDKLFVLTFAQDSFDDLLLKGKILLYVQIAETILQEIENQTTRDDFTAMNESWSQLQRCSYFFGCQTIMEVNVLGTSSDEIITKNIDSYYMTPFGAMRRSLHYDSKTDYTSKRETVQEMVVTQDGKLVCPLENEKFFKWFRNEENIKINQFWTKVQMPDENISYNCITVMSMSEDYYEKILQWCMKSLQEGEIGLWEEDIFQ